VAFSAMVAIVPLQALVTSACSAEVASLSSNSADMLMRLPDFDYCSNCLNTASVRSKHATNHKFFSISKPSDPIHRGIICDGCERAIAGVRHKCLDCRDFDFCTSCIVGGAIERTGHSPFHQFHEIATPGRVIVHNVYTGVGENTTSGSERTQPAQPAAPVTPPSPPVAPERHAAMCDLCDSTIVGDRYVRVASNSCAAR
jgi:hypothetical protein